MTYHAVRVALRLIPVDLEGVKRRPPRHIPTRGSPFGGRALPLSKIISVVLGLVQGNARPGSRAGGGTGDGGEGGGGGAGGGTLQHTLLLLNAPLLLDQKGLTIGAHQVVGST